MATRSSRNGKNNSPVASSSTSDDGTNLVGSLCSSFEGLCGASTVVEMEQAKPAVLEYVFDQVESLQDRGSMMDRDNSLLVTDNQGHAEQLETQRKTRKNQNGEVDNPDLLDYVFENVESFVCNHQPERTGGGAHKKSPSNGTASTEPNDSYEQEDEDEILLVFRPQSYRVP